MSSGPPTGPVATVPRTCTCSKMLPPRKHGVLIPGPQSHLMKLAFEKYFLWKTRHGYVNLP